MPYISLDGICPLRYSLCRKNWGCRYAFFRSSQACDKEYDQEKVDRIPVRVPKGKKEMIHAHAEQMGESVGAFLNRTVDETVERDERGLP